MPRPHRILRTTFLLPPGGTGGLSASGSEGYRKHPHPACGHPLPEREGISTRAGFTLIEMMVSITILLVLAVITLSAINLTQSYDRVRSAARQVQSYYEGAKSRAGYAKDARGVRFLLDATDPTTVSSMVFIGPPEKFSQDDVAIYTEMTAPTSNGDATLDSDEDLNMNGTDDPIYIDYPPIWKNSTAGVSDLTDRNRLFDGARLELPRDSQAYYTIAQSQNGSGRWYLTRDYQGGTIPSGPLDYELQLEPAILPNQEPRSLGQGIVIDLDPTHSKIPTSWTAGGNLDILFTPRGAVTGSAAGEGTIHLVLASTADTANNVPPGAGAWQASTAYTAGQWVRPTLDNRCYYRSTGGGTSGSSQPAWPTVTGQTVSDGPITWECFQVTEKLLVSLFTHTGRVSTHSISTVESTPGVVDIYREAEIGREVR
ncbi:MAG: Tfp pilus assembly protein FimT/FimU [Planctomycetaceae bacterium]